ncbi:uncharacterized protein BJ171DRAFT_598161 [Polychytrium aggregatum]|uniref:uncharacterized protein n=1 Tax=Polychytrium aggregatum TaxID=110093 RepID=UPI0022FEC622|nr:uncharacterized protein BJ171DRAFT_598161 [Polychytrium aggregatum]KAI9205474.1 hypothetical protein BJ171DRAFT_598161 [Polychytrium aggregatum]
MVLFPKSPLLSKPGLALSLPKFRQFKRALSLAVVIALIWMISTASHNSITIWDEGSLPQGNLVFHDRLYRLIETATLRYADYPPYLSDIYAQHGISAEKPCQVPMPTLPLATIADEPSSPLNDTQLCEIDRSKYAIKVDGPIGEPTSFGTVASNIALHLDRLGYPIILETWTPDIRLSPELENIRARQPNQRPNLTFRVSHIDSLAAKPSTHYFGLTVSEVPIMPHTTASAQFNRFLEPSSSRFQKKLFVPTRFSQELLSGAVPDAQKRVNLFPHGFDAEIFTYKYRFDRLESNRYQFIWVSVWGGRKNTRAVLEAFSFAFPKGTLTTASGRTINVELKIVCGYPPTIQQWEHDHWNSKPGVVIVEAAADRPATEIARFYHEADCFVFPSFSEGFGLTVLEAMATGLPVIVPEYSGMKDFCDRETCVMIPPTRLIGLNFGSHYGCGADLDPRVMAPVMKEMVLNRYDSLVIGRKAAEKVHRHWTWRQLMQSFDQNHVCPLFAGQAEQRIRPTEEAQSQ